MSKKSKKSLNHEQSQVETPEQQELKEAASAPEAEGVITEVVKEEEPLTLESIHTEFNALRELVFELASQMTALQSTPSRKRKAVPNGKIQILDKVTGEVYPSKNNAYQTLLKAGELKELVDKGIFGPDPEKNTFGWYALVRAWPDRFEEKKVEEVAASK